MPNLENPGANLLYGGSVSATEVCEFASLSVRLIV